MGNTLKVGELLMHAGVIDESQLEEALVEHKRWGRRIGVTLIKLGLVEENHLIRALAQQLGLPATSLVGRRIAPEVIALVPARIATQHSVIPLFIKRNANMGKLFLGMEDPSKMEVLDDLCFRTGLEIQPVMMGPTELAQAIDRYYHHRKDARSAGEPDLPAGETTMGERSLGLSDSNSITLDKSDAVPASADVEDSRAVSESGADSSASTVDGQAIARFENETEKTRVVVKAITQILVEKEVLSLDELQSRVAKLKGSDSPG